MEFKTTKMIMGKNQDEDFDLPKTAPVFQQKISDSLLQIVPADDLAKIQLQKTAELELFFAVHKIPVYSIQLTPWERITNPSAFVLATIKCLRNNIGTKIFDPYYQRIATLKLILTNQP